ncbi:hypothetical protein BDV40DRAFT_287471 [Aspergillus tamarii]|uniref:Uncharacterized protein n=1 Tax=Aspergillus tamarii TaxID=41984 RepID=A0A5N6UYI4_ASPTM|nr:hypothetical protein BDV40DRAFT_287471 [Aspergillus tamarii]
MSRAFFRDSTTARYFRAGGPDLCEAPYNCRRLPSDHIPFDDIERILHNCNIRFLVTSPSLVECTPGYDDSAEPIQTLQVLSRRHDNDSRDYWLHAVQEIHTLLCSRGLDNITIDIIDWQLARGPEIYLCKSSDAIFPKWDTVRKQIVQMVDISGFQLLGCYRIGHDFGEENSTPSVLVTVDPKVERDWSSVEHDIRMILTEFDLGMVDVRIFKDRNIFCARQSWDQTQTSPSLPTVEEECPTRVTIGNGQFGLTCRHCVFDHVFTDLHIFEEKEEALRYMEGQKKDPKDRTLNITEPRSRDMIDEKRRSNSFRTLEEIQAAEDHPEDLTQKWGDLKKSLGDLENHLTELEAYKRAGSYEFGEVWADSGDDTRKTTTIMDWALLKPHPNRAYPSNQFASFSSLGERAPMPRIGHIKAGIVLPDEKNLFKQGCKTGVTWGKYSNLATTVFTATKSGELRTIDEHSVVYDIKHDFFKPGDSGSLIYDERGRIVGMAFGGQMTGQIVVFTHIDNLIADVKDQTGAERVVFYGQEEPVEEYDVDQN